MELETIALLASIAEGVVSIVTLITILISLYLVLRQTQEMTEQSAASVHATISSTYQAISSQAIEINRIFFDHPDLKPYFYDNVPPPEDPLLRAKLESLAEIHMDFMDMALVQVETRPPEVDIPFEVYETYFRQILETSPVMREYYKGYRLWYSPPVRAIADQVVGISS